MSILKKLFLRSYEYVFVNDQDKLNEIKELSFINPLPI